MNKGLIKALIMPVLMAIASLGVCVTGTFAMFTEQAEVQIQVNAGLINFNVTPAVSTTNFHNGGASSATIIDGNPVIAGATSGDSVTFSLAASNTSNVNVKYRGYVHISNQAWLNCVNVTASNFVSTWSDVIAPENSPANATVGLSFTGDIHGLPSEALTVQVGYEVVQGNAEIGNADEHIGYMNFVAENSYDYVAKDYLNNIKVTGHYTNNANKILTTEVLTDLVTDNADAYYVYNNDTRVAGYLISAPAGGTSLEVTLPCAQPSYTIKKGNADVSATISGGYATFAL